MRKVAGKDINSEFFLALDDDVCILTYHKKPRAIIVPCQFNEDGWPDWRTVFGILRAFLGTEVKDV